MDDVNNKIPVGISSCLLGDEVRYDGGHKYNPAIIEDLGEYFRFIPFCPEVDIGLGIPREPIHLVLVGDEIRCVGTETGTMDVTERLIDCADGQRPWQRGIFGYILKQNSPSCGVRQVKLLRDSEIERIGVGIYANRLMQNFPDMPVAEEVDLEDRVLRDGFVQKVCDYRYWCKLDSH